MHIFESLFLKKAAHALRQNPRRFFRGADGQNRVVRLEGFFDRLGHPGLRRRIIRGLLLEGQKAEQHAQGEQYQNHSIFVENLFHDAMASERMSSWLVPATSVISPLIRPSCMTMIRSLMPRISGNSLLIIMIAFPSATSLFMSR